MKTILLAVAAALALASPGIAQDYPPGPPIVIDPPVAPPPPPPAPELPNDPVSPPSVVVTPRRPPPVVGTPICYTNAPYTALDQLYGYQAAVLNIRAWANGPILGALANGTPVQVLNVDASNGSWANVVIPDGSFGWVFLPYLYCGWR